jgi:hypothetical protein
MSVSEAFSGVVDESVESIELAPTVNGFHLEPRCRICRNDQLRTKVNDLLATGASYAMVLRALGDDNAKLEQRDRVTIDSGLLRNRHGQRLPDPYIRDTRHRGTMFWPPVARRGCCWIAIWPIPRAVRNAGCSPRASLLVLCA